MPDLFIPQFFHVQRRSVAEPFVGLHVSILASFVNTLFSYGSWVTKDPLRDIISSHVARLLKHERESQGISLNLLAEKAGLSRQTISYVEQEAQSPSLDTLLRITRALETDLEKIIARARKHAVAEKRRDIP